jgi:hypothetical protein
MTHALAMRLLHATREQLHSKPTREVAPLDVIPNPGVLFRLCGVAGGGEGLKTMMAFEVRCSPRMEGFRRIPYDSESRA